MQTTFCDENGERKKQLAQNENVVGWLFGWFFSLSLSLIFSCAIGFMSFFDDNFPHFCYGIFHLRRFQQIYYSKHTWKQHKNKGKKPTKNTDEVKRKPRDQVVRIYITTKWQQPVCAPCSFVFSFVFLLYFCFNCLAFFFLYLRSLSSIFFVSAFDLPSLLACMDAAGWKLTVRQRNYFFTLNRGFIHSCFSSSWCIHTMEYCII